MVAECCETPEETVEAAVDLAKRMASQGPLAVRTAVRSLRLGQDDGLDRTLWREADAQVRVILGTHARTHLSIKKKRRTRRRKKKKNWHDSLIRLTSGGISIICFTFAHAYLYSDTYIPDDVTVMTSLHCLMPITALLFNKG